MSPPLLKLPLSMMELQDVTKGPGGVTRAAGSLSRADSGLQQGDLSRAWRCRTGVKSHVGGRVYLTRYAERDTCSRSTSSVSVAALGCASHPKSGSARKKRAAAHVPGNVRLFYRTRLLNVVPILAIFLQPGADSSLISSSRNTGCDLQ